MLNKSAGSFIRVYIPHLIEDDEYRCNICGFRFKKDIRICPGCGIFFSGTVVDKDEYEDEKEKMGFWKENGL